MTKVEKLQRVLRKISKVGRDGKNRLRKVYYLDGEVCYESVEHIDIYSPTFYKYHPSWLVGGFEIEVVHSLPLHTCDMYELWLSGGGDCRRVHIDELYDEELDELLALKDWGEVVTMNICKEKKKEVVPANNQSWSDELCQNITLAVAVTALCLSVLNLIF